MKDQELFNGLKKGDNKALKAIYVTYKEAFLVFTRSYDMSAEDALDIYQDSILALRENIARGKLTELKSSLKTYLFSIGKYMIFDFFRAQKKMHIVKTDSIKLIELSDDFEVRFNEKLDNKELKLKRTFETLGEKCKAILTLFYYQEYNIEEISKILNYNSKDVVKSQKSRCLKTLKEKMSDGR